MFENIQRDINLGIWLLTFKRDKRREKMVYAEHINIPIQQSFLLKKKVRKNIKIDLLMIYRYIKKKSWIKTIN